MFVYKPPLSITERKLMNFSVTQKSANFASSILA